MSNILVAGAVSLMTLAQVCGPNVHPTTTMAIIKVESGGNPYAINDNTSGHSYSFTNKDDAVYKSYELLTLGHSIDMGLMQINSVHLKGMKIRYYDLFEPCYNVQIGTKILSDFYVKYSEPGLNKEQRLYRALSAYNTGSPWKGTRYTNKILAAARSNRRVYVVRKFSENSVKIPRYQAENNAISFVKAKQIMAADSGQKRQ